MAKNISQSHSRITITSKVAGADLCVTPSTVQDCMCQGVMGQIRVPLILDYGRPWVTVLTKLLSRLPITASLLGANFIYHSQIRGMKLKGLGRPEDGSSGNRTRVSGTRVGDSNHYIPPYTNFSRVLRLNRLNTH